MRVNLIRTEHPWELIIVNIFLCLVKTQRVTFPFCRHLVVTLSKYLNPSQDDMHKVGDVIRWVVFSGDEEIHSFSSSIGTWLSEEANGQPTNQPITSHFKYDAINCIVFTLEKVLVKNYSLLFLAEINNPISWKFVRILQGG